LPTANCTPSVSLGEAGKNRAKDGRAVINSSGGEYGRPDQYPSA
jgi:hypothetical protein